MELSDKVKRRLLNTYGEWAIVTGASSGIGRELATQLAGAGFNLIINARNIERLKSVASELKTYYNVKIIIVEADVSDSSGIERIIDAAQNLNVGLLINNAGYGTSGLFVNSSLQQEINMLNVNCRAVLSLTHYFSQRFMEQHRGGIIFLSSLVAFQGVPKAANYAATKAYIQTFSEALAIELKPFGVDVLAASPGPVESGFGKRADMVMNKSVPANKIGVPILNALGKNSTVIPGVFSKVLLYSLKTVPRFVKIKIMEKVMGGFTKHQLR